jgi:hypothetical protein
MTNTYQHRVLKKANLLMSRCNRGMGPQYKQWLKQGEGPTFIFKLELEEGNSIAHRAMPKIRISRKLPSTYHYAIQNVQTFLKKKAQQNTVDNIALWIAVSAWGHLKVVEKSYITAYQDEAISNANKVYLAATSTLEQMVSISQQYVSEAKSTEKKLDALQILADKDAGADIDDWESCI